MGTRSMTVFRVVDKLEAYDICAMYRQMDGYPTGHGQELANLLKGHRICNGISLGQKKKVYHNGMGCLAAYVIGYLKWEQRLDGTTGDHPIGNIYMEPVVAECLDKDSFIFKDGETWCGIEYGYILYNVGYRIRMRVVTHLCNYDLKPYTKHPTIIFDDVIEKYNGKRVEAFHQKVIKEFEGKSKKKRSVTHGT